MSSETNETDIELRAQIDRSLRFPLLFFFTSAAVWLVFGTALGFISSLTLNFPRMFEGIAFLSYGRVFPAQMNALVYGWGMQAGFGVALWIMARLSRSTLKNPATVIVAGHIWNAMIMFGLFAILFGWGTSIMWLDFPKAFAPAVIGTYIVVMIWALGMFAARRDREVYISQWYIVASILWFPWIYLTANWFIHIDEGAAVIKTGINAWYVSNMIYMVLAPIALAAAYYIVPKVIGRPIFSYGIAVFGFWTLAIFAGWSGMNRLMGGPLPAWMPTFGSTAAIFLLIPALSVAFNLVKTMGARSDWVSYSPALRFTIFGVFAFVITVALGAIMSIFPAGKIFQFTHAQAGYDLLAVYGFYSMTIIGAIYFIVPRIVGCEWINGGWIRFHFWFSAYGTIAIVAFMVFAGMAQGYIINNWGEDFLTSVERGKPYLASLALGWGFIVVSNIAFLFHLGLMAFKRGRTDDVAPTLIHKQPEDYFSQPELSKEGANA
ncbi:MAG: cbb3-type cytochrome c oxidase subunit I [Verrucomicrobiota bacterium]